MSVRLDWLWNLTDDDTEFWISSLISKRREVSDARALFQDAKTKLMTMPIAVTHDNLCSYRAAFKNEFYTNAKPQTTEARSISIRQRELNNRIERLNQALQTVTRRGELLIRPNVHN